MTYSVVADDAVRPPPVSIPGEPSIQTRDAPELTVQPIDRGQYSGPHGGFQVGYGLFPLLDPPSPPLPSTDYLVRPL